MTIEIVRSTRGTTGNRLTQNERDLLRHTMMWGSASYPVAKVRSRWMLIEFFGISLPGTFRTKREAVAQYEAYIRVLVDADAQESIDRHNAEEAAA